MVQNQIEDYYQIMFSSNYFLFLLKTLQVTLFAWASRPNPLVYASNCHTTNAPDPRPRLGPAKLFGGIWSCIDDIEFEWVTADSVLATACWKGVKWRASTWARRPLPAESQRRVTLELEEEEEASDIHLGQKGQFQNIRNEWVKHLASFSSKSCHQNRNGSTLHPFPHPLKPLSLCASHVDASSLPLMFPKCDTVLLYVGNLSMQRHPSDHRCSRQHGGNERSIVCRFMLHGQLTSFPINQMHCLLNLS